MLEMCYGNRLALCGSTGLFILFCFHTFFWGFCILYLNIFLNYLEHVPNFLTGISFHVFCCL
jgi:hypothetical protein